MDLELPKGVGENEEHIVSMFKEVNREILPQMNSILQKERIQKREMSQKGFKVLQQGLR